MFLLFIISSGTTFAFSFAVFGDNHGRLDILSDIFAKIKNDTQIKFAVDTGDLVSNGNAEQYRKYSDFISKSGVKVYNVMGNHDAVSGGYRLFFRYFGPDHYSFDYENAHFIVLNNSLKGSFDKAQMDFLTEDLQKNRNKVIFVFFHRPTFDPSELYSDYIMSERKVAENMMELFQKYRVRYVFTGHIHAYLKMERNRVVYVVSGGAGGPLHLPAFMGGFYHYVKITVDGDKIKDEVVKLNK